MVKLIIILMFTVYTGAVGGETKCYEYDAKNFTFHITNNETQESKKLNLQNLKIYYFANRSSTKPITVGYTVNGRDYYNKYIFCLKQKNIEWCGVECDGGGFNLDKEFRINIEREISLYRDDPDTPNGIEKVLEQKNSSHYIKGREFICPKELPTTTNLIDEKEYNDDPKGLFVCYGYKIDNEYNGCFRAKNSCKSIGKNHFGKYPNIAQSKKAITRCVNSNPK